MLEKLFGTICLNGTFPSFFGRLEGTVTKNAYWGLPQAPQGLPPLVTPGPELALEGLANWHWYRYCFTLKRSSEFQLGTQILALGLYFGEDLDHFRSFIMQITCIYLCYIEIHLFVYPFLDSYLRISYLCINNFVKFERWKKYRNCAMGKFALFVSIIICIICIVICKDLLHFRRIRLIDLTCCEFERQRFNVHFGNRQSQN